MSDQELYAFVAGWNAARGYHPKADVAWPERDAAFTAYIDGLPALPKWSHDV